MKMKSILLAGTAVLLISAATITFMPHGLHALVQKDSHAHGGEDDHDHAHGEARSDTPAAPQQAGDNDHGHAHGDEDEEDEHAEGSIDLTPAQIAAAGIQTAAAQKGTLAQGISTPGKIIPAADRMAEIVPKLGGIVTEVRKNLGDTVQKGETLALIESREMAETLADFQAAKRAEELARTTFNREKNLWDKKITAEQDYLSARNAHQESRIRLEAAKQKLQAIGYDEKTSGTEARFLALTSPIAGRIIDRALTLGAYVDSPQAVFTVADLGVVWVETALPPGNLGFFKEGQEAVISSGNHEARGKLIFISPAISADTRTAKALIELGNAGGLWRPGAFVTALITSPAAETMLLVPKSALQTIEGQAAVFIRTAHGFEKRAVMTGQQDSRQVEIISGLQEGEEIAITGTFTLKAELGKSEAEHAH